MSNGIHMIGLTIFGFQHVWFTWSDAVSRETHEDVTRQLNSLEESESKLKVEVSRLKEVAEVAAHQTEAIKGQQESQDKELTSLRKQLYDMQMESDEKTIIGELRQSSCSLVINTRAKHCKCEMWNIQCAQCRKWLLQLCWPWLPFAHHHGNHHDDIQLVHIRKS